MINANETLLDESIEHIVHVTPRVETVEFAGNLANRQLGA
jgi:hypothetical protein